MSEERIEAFDLLAKAGEHLNNIEDPMRNVDERGGPYLSYCAQHVVDAFKAGTLAQPRPASKAESALVERIASFVEGWNGETADGHTGMIASEIRERFAALSDRDVVLEEARAALEPFGNPDLLMQIADDDDEEWAKFRLLCSDYRRAGRALTRIDAALKERV